MHDLHSAANLGRFGGDQSISGTDEAAGFANQHIDVEDEEV